MRPLTIAKEYTSRIIEDVANSTVVAAAAIESGTLSTVAATIDAKGANETPGYADERMDGKGILATAWIVATR